VTPVKLLSTLKNRIFLASTLVAVLSIGFAIRFVTSRVTRDAETGLQRGLQEAGTQVQQHYAARLETLTVMARLIADLPRLKAGAATGDPPTVQPLAADYRQRVRADLLVVTDREGHLLAALGPEADLAGTAAVRSALEGRESTTYRAHREGMLQIVTVPIAIGTDAPDVLGTLSLGVAVDDAQAGHFKAVTASEVAFTLDGHIRASTLPDAFDEAVAGVAAEGVSVLQLGPDEYVAVRRPLAGAAGGAGEPVAVILRSRTERLSFLRTFHAALAVAALVAVLLAVLLSYAVARTVTRPLAAITATMREMSATGDLAGKILLQGPWEDEDTRVLARAFNALTESITRFQREAGLRERLSALGRLSTVIAHEIRNPLMIIKASLRTLTRASAAPEEVKEAVADIDHEVARLNRIVDDVLDFARPLRMDLAPADLNALCRSAAAAALASDGVTRVEMSLDPRAAEVVTDAERLRTVLVNILANARTAVGSRAAPHPPPDIHLRTRAVEAGRVAVEVEDHGVGVDPADLPHIFEPYFSTRRTGSGLGLAIAKNIVDSLGGTISASSQPGQGTQIRIELPMAPAPRPAAS
jgi:signal transduction histidine kinase